MATKTRVPAFTIDRVRPGLGNKNSWAVSEKGNYRGLLWYSGGKWNAQFALSYDREAARSIMRGDGPADCVAYLLERAIEPEKLVGFDLELLK